MAKVQVQYNSVDMHPNLVKQSLDLPIEIAGSEATDGSKGRKIRLALVVQEDGSEAMMDLPLITAIEMPATLTKSARIRWLHTLGYTVAEIYGFLGCKYQMVRNIVTTVPKRAAREDLPPLKVRYREVNDEIQDALDGALEASLLVDRKDRKKTQKEVGVYTEGEDD